MAGTVAVARRRPLWVTSVLVRPATFLCLLLLSATAVATSVLAPLLLRAVEQVTLSDAVDRGAPSVRAVTATASAADSPTRAVDVVTGITAHLRRGRRAALWGPVRTTAASTGSLTWLPAPGRPLAHSRVSAALHGCAGVRLVSGSCPGGPTEVLVPLSVLAGRPAPATVDSRTDTPPVRLRVVGVYDDARSPGLDVLHPGSGSSAAGATASDLVVLPGALDAFDIATTATSTVHVRRGLGVDDAPRVRAQVGAAEAAALTPEAAHADALVTARLPEVLDHLATQHAAARSLLTIEALEAVVLSWAALGLLVQRIGRVRAREWGVGRLRGLALRPWLVQVFAEPVVALLVGAVLGAVVGTGVVRVVLDLTVGTAAPLEPARLPVVLAAVLTTAGSLVALVLASVRSARLPLAVLLRETTEPRRLGRAAFAAQVGVVLVAGVAVYASRTGGVAGSRSTTLLVPPLVALAVAGLVLQGALLLVRTWTRRPPRSLVALVVGRQLARTPTVLSGAVAVCVALALAAHALEVGAVARRLQDDREAARVGAATVLRVRAPAGTSLPDAVAAADPGGRAAMAAEELTRSAYEGTSHLLAVDTSRLAAVSSWPASSTGLSAAQLEHRLAPRGGPSLRLSGARLRLVVDDLQLDDASGDVIDLQAVVADARRWHVVDLGALAEGGADSGAGGLPCSRGCRLVSLATVDTDTTDPHPYTASFTITSLGTDVQPASSLAPWLHRAGRWRERVGDEQDSAMPSRASAVASPAGLQVAVRDDSGAYTTGIAPRDVPEPLPVLVGSTTVAPPFPGVPSSTLGTGLDGSSRVLRVVGEAPVLPRVGGDGAVVDLRAALGSADPSRSLAEQMVWLAPGEHPRVLAALRAEGVRVLGRQSLAAQQRLARRAAPTLAATLGAAVAVAAALLGLEALVTTRLVGAPQRRTTSTALRAAGVAARRRRLLGVVEVLVPGAVGALLGVLTGALAFALTAPRLPLLPGAGAVPTPRYGPPVLLLAVLTALVVAVLVVVAVVAARLEERGGRLR